MTDYREGLLLGFGFGLLVCLVLFMFGAVEVVR